MIELGFWQITIADIISYIITIIVAIFAVNKIVNVQNDNRVDKSNRSRRKINQSRSTVFGDQVGGDRNDNSTKS